MFESFKKAIDLSRQRPGTGDGNHGCAKDGAMSGQTRLPSLKAEGMVDETRSTSIEGMRDTMFLERLLQLMNNGQPPENQDQESRPNSGLPRP